MVSGHGTNDMRRGWTVENEWNKRIYEKWRTMLKRCYSEKYHERFPTYKDCTVCNRWLLLSNFVEDFKLIDGYDEKKFLNGELVLDKDIKSNGTNKEYSLENCMWTSREENIKQANKTRDNSYMQGENNQRSIKIAQYDKKTNELIKIWNSVHEIERELNINNGNIIKCCKFWVMSCNKEEWFKTYKAYPHKSCGGYVFKYVEEDDEID